MGKVIVVGGGAAGMMAAASAAARGRKVCLVEKNEKLGKKLYITGKGRCNVTNAGDGEEFFENVRSNSKFLYSAFYGWDNRDLMAFLEGAGCRLKTERGGRVFPVSDHASDVIKAFRKELDRLGVEILLNTEVSSLVFEDSLCRGVRLSDGRVLGAESCIVCTGGLSYPTTGSTGDGYRFAGAAGHRITACRPSLVPFGIRETWCGKLAGLSLKNVSLGLVCGGREVYRGFGEMLFTHSGVSGPLVLSASSYYREGKGAALLYVDLKPALDPEQLDRRLLRDFEENRNRQFQNALGGLFPAKLVPVMVELSGIDPEKQANMITREERVSFVRLIKRLGLTVSGLRGFDEAIVTKGGIDVRGIDPATMESKLVKGVYFVGEALDLDALTGGFNLQIAWSTAHAAGSSIV